MGQAFDRNGNVIGEATGATKREVFEALDRDFKDSAEIRIRTADVLERELGFLKQARTIDDHFDGHGLADSIQLLADPPGPGGASHEYRAYVGDLEVARVKFQKGPRHEPGSTPGILDGVLLAIVVDRMRAFDAGEYRCRENALVRTKAEEALHWLKHRADERARRKVLGTYQT
jgi:hypothetical protein